MALTKDGYYDYEEAHQSCDRTRAYQEEMRSRSTCEPSREDRLTGYGPMRTPEEVSEEFLTLQSLKLHIGRDLRGAWVSWRGCDKPEGVTESSFDEMDGIEEAETEEPTPTYLEVMTEVLQRCDLEKSMTSRRLRFEKRLELHREGLMVSNWPTKENKDAEVTVNR